MFRNFLSYKKFLLLKKKKSINHQNKLNIKFTNILNKIYSTKDKQYINKTQLKIIRQFLKFIMNSQNKFIINKTKKQILDVIQILNKKKIINNINNLDQLNEKKVVLKKINEYIESNNNNEVSNDIYTLQKLLLVYTKKIIFFKKRDDYIDYKDHDLILQERKLILIKLEDLTKIVIKYLYHFWFPFYKINTQESLYNSSTVLKIYIFLKCPNFIDDVKTAYYLYHKREHIFKIIIAWPWFFLQSVNRYSRSLIIYSKRLLCYYNIIVDDIHSYKYNPIEINLNISPYKNTLFNKNLNLIFQDIKLRLIEGYYDKYIIVSLLQLNETYLDPIYLKKEMLDQLIFDLNNVNLIFLNEVLPFNYFWI